ncbi:hypothetical protein DFR50_16711 [Roseiarcus fermentans]|uniref:Uncharacterized protein n=1 Tax=Roseiarcus fermentans TaxID=1473586 RepID=A0A366EH84_9HYPH|nr:hypothetical protein DFR50_16711 [Roseiarcus fermentans]
MKIRNLPHTTPAVFSINSSRIGRAYRRRRNRRSTAERDRRGGLVDPPVGATRRNGSSLQSPEPFGKAAGATRGRERLGGGSGTTRKPQNQPNAGFVVRTNGSGPQVSLAPALPSDGADNGYAIVWREEERTQFTPPKALVGRLIGGGALRRPFFRRSARIPGIGRNREDGEGAGDAAQQNAPRYIGVRTARRPSAEFGGAVLIGVVRAQRDCPNLRPSRSRYRLGGRSVCCVRFGADRHAFRRRPRRLSRRRTHCETNGAVEGLRAARRPGQCRTSRRGKASAGLRIRVNVP